MEVRMLKVLPEKAAKYWDQLSFFIEKALPPTANPNARMIAVFENLLLGRGDLFQFVGYEDSRPVELLGLVILVPFSSFDQEGRNMLVYAIASYKRLGKTTIEEGWKLIVKYAKSVGCNGVVAYVNSESAAKFLEGLGADTSQRLVRMEV